LRLFSCTTRAFGFWWFWFWTSFAAASSAYGAAAFITSLSYGSGRTCWLRRFSVSFCAAVLTNTLPHYRCVFNMVLPSAFSRFCCHAVPRFYNNPHGLVSSFVACSTTLPVSAAAPAVASDIWMRFCASYRISTCCASLHLAGEYLGLVGSAASAGCAFLHFFSPAFHHRHGYSSTTFLSFLFFFPAR